jgi:hypothetical protein
MTHVKNLPYAPDNGGTPHYGTDIEFATLAGERYALAGSYKNGLQITNVSGPSQAKIVSTYDCGITQGDVQVFRQADMPGRTFVTYTSETFGDGTSTCCQEATALGFDVLKPDGRGENGTFIAEITDPLNPRTISFVEVAQGSHNQTVHPSGNFLYNSNSDLITSLQPAIEIFDISNPAAPKSAGELSSRRGPASARSRMTSPSPTTASARTRPPLAGRDHRHAQPRPTHDHLELPGHDESTSGTRWTRSR